jgi:hypothetical protein
LNVIPRTILSTTTVAAVLQGGLAGKLLLANVTPQSDAVDLGQVVNQGGLALVLLPAHVALEEDLLELLAAVSPGEVATQGGGRHEQQVAERAHEGLVLGLLLQDAGVPLVDVGHVATEAPCAP